MDTLRLAVISTPRTGNCWLRHMLAQVLELDHLIVHLPSEVNWNALPSRAILQLHWLPDESFVSLLAEHGFRVVTLARHPLDVLISVLAFSQHDDSTLRWLDGAGGDERCMAGAAPLDEAFLKYATGPRAGALLDVSTSWWKLSGVCRVRYEDLVSDTAGQLAAILRTFRLSPRHAPDEVAARATPEDMRTQNVHMLFHVWQAQGSLWRRLLTAPAAQQICGAHRAVMKTLEYTCDPDGSLSAAAARAAWEQYDAAAVKRHLSGVKKTLIEAQARHNLEVCNQHDELERQRVEIQQQRVELEKLVAQFEQLSSRQAVFNGLGPRSLDTARALHDWSRRFPRLATVLKSLVLHSRRT